MDKVDVKAQTPLFVAMVNQHWECAEALLEAGADPNGNEKNLCTPLAVMAQRGYYEGMCTAKRKLERLQFSTSSSFVKI